MKEVKAAIRELRVRASVYTKLAEALTHLDRFADRRSVKKRGGKRKISRAGRLAIAQAQKRRWRRWHKANGVK